MYFTIIKNFKERKNSEASWSGGDRTGCAGGGRRVPWSIRQDWASCHPIRAIRWRRRRRSIKRVVGWSQCHRSSKQRPRGNEESCGDQREAIARAKALRLIWLELGEWVRTEAGGEGGERMRQRMQNLVGYEDNLGFYSEEGGSHRWLWAEEGHGLTQELRGALWLLWWVGKEELMGERVNRAANRPGYAGTTRGGLWRCWEAGRFLGRCWSRSQHDLLMGFPNGSNGKGSACQCRRLRFNPRVRKIPWRREWQPTPVFLPGDFHGQRSLAHGS